MAHYLLEYYHPFTPALCDLSLDMVSDACDPGAVDIGHALFSKEQGSSRINMGPLAERRSTLYLCHRCHADGFLSYLALRRTNRSDAEGTPVLGEGVGGRKGLFDSVKF